MNACTSAGMIYGPTHANADANRCVPNFTFTSGAKVKNGFSVFGGASINGPATLQDGLTVNGAATTLENGLTVNGANASFDKGVSVRNGLDVSSGNVTVTNRLTASEIYVGSGNLGKIPTCIGDKKIQWSGTAWICVSDALGSSAGTTETDPQVGGLVNGRLCRTDGAKVICDAAFPASSAYSNPPICPNSQKLQWSGGAWNCVADQGLVSESDPKVGATAAGKWCRGTGSSITCDQSPPLAGGSGCAARNINCHNTSISVPAMGHAQARTFKQPGTDNNYCFIQCYNGTLTSTISGN